MTLDSHWMQITWSSPYTLPGTKITYFVNVTVNGRYSNSLRATTFNNHYNLSFSEIDIDQCHSNVINITVSGSNPAGEGEPSSLTFGHKQNSTELCSGNATNRTQEIIDQGK